MSSVSSTPCEVNVFYKNELQRKALYKEIKALEKPNVIFWYMKNTLYEKTAFYYRADLTAIQASVNMCYLYDLTAWSATKDRRFSISSCNVNADKINELSLKIPKICCLKSSEYFSWLKTCSPPEREYLKKVVWSRPFIFGASKGLKSGLTLGEMFQNQCPLFEDDYKKDADESYSALQYIEGLYLITPIVGKLLATTSKVINVVFALFNDEEKYYKDAQNSFAKDLQSLLTIKYGAALQGRVINVYFYNVNYGTREGKGVASNCLKWRPYLEVDAKTINCITEAHLIAKK